MSPVVAGMPEYTERLMYAQAISIGLSSWFATGKKRILI